MIDLYVSFDDLIYLERPNSSSTDTAKPGNISSIAFSCYLSPTPRECYQLTILANRKYMMNLKTLPATEVKNRFDRVLREVSKSGGPIVIERDGKAVAVIIGIEQYETLSRRPLLDDDQKTMAREAFGMWANREDISDEWWKTSREQWHSGWHNDQEPVLE